MLEIRGKEISELTDEDLWALVGWLCEAELHSKGLPSAGVTWGGDPNAGDGGIDVGVDLSTPFDFGKTGRGCRRYRYSAHAVIPFYS